MTNQFTDEQVRLALDAFVGGNFFTEYPQSIAHWEPRIRAALEAAAGAAPQAPKDIHEPNHDRVYCVRCGGNWPCQPSPAHPSSTVLEAAAGVEPQAECSERPGGRPCESGKPGHKMHWSNGPKTVDACHCTAYSEDRGGGYFELMLDPEPDCPEHGELIAVQVLPSSTVDEAALIREAKAEALEEFASQMATGFNPQTLNAERRAIKREARTRAAEYREGSET